MADEIPVVPKAGTLTINSGNIVNWNRLKKKPSQNPTEEVGLKHPFAKFLDKCAVNPLWIIFRGSQHLK